MNKKEICQFLNNQGIRFEITEHEAVFNMAEVGMIGLPYPEADAKNLFVRDDKKRNYYLITVKWEKRVDLKEFRRAHGLRALSFAKADELMQIMGLIPGAVTPLGLLNDEGCKVKMFLDDSFRNEMIGVHPNDNTATVWVMADDLVRIIREHGNEVEWTEL